jgi:3-hydroxypropanoate dehydrogenase
MSATALPTLDRLPETDLDQLFTQGRTPNSFDDTPVSNEELASIWDLARWAPTAANFQPMRVLFVQNPEARQRLVSHMAEGNQAKTLAAPAVAVLAYDREFHQHLPQVTPHRPDLAEFFGANETPRIETAKAQAWLQAGYFILAARSIGLAAGPMGGFDAPALDADLLSDGRWGSFLVINLGHPTEGSYRDRLPRVDVDDVVRFA